jgi:hypothetical protein
VQRASCAEPAQEEQPGQRNQGEMAEGSGAHELKRRNEAPIALIEMLDALLSLDPSLTAKQKRKRSCEIMATALQRLERKDA